MIPVHLVWIYSFHAIKLKSLIQQTPFYLKYNSMLCFIPLSLPFNFGKFLLYFPYLRLLFRCKLAYLLHLIRFNLNNWILPSWHAVCWVYVYILQQRARSHAHTHTYGNNIRCISGNEIKLMYTMAARKSCTQVKDSFSHKYSGEFYCSTSQLTKG